MASGDAADINETPSYTDHNGFLMPRGFPVDGFVSGLKYAAQENDIFVATYPKCGTTWMQHMIYLLLNQGIPIQPNERLDQIFPHVEEVGAEYMTKQPLWMSKFRLVKTHLPFSMTPQNEKAKYIFVARNPKDCVVSFYHHTKGFPKHYNFANGEFDVFFQLFLEGRVDFGSYFDTLKSWIGHRTDPNVLFLTYEDLKADPAKGIEKVAGFLFSECHETNPLLRNPSLLDSILKHSSVQSMKEHPLRWSSARSEDHEPFIRQGKVGSYNELLSEDQAHALNGKMREMFSRDELELLGPRYHQE